MPVPYVGISKVLDVTGYYKLHCKTKFFDSLKMPPIGPHWVFVDRLYKQNYNGQKQEGGVPWQTNRIPIGAP